MTAYLDLLLRGVGLACQAGAIGGAFFILLVLRAAREAESATIVARSLRLTTASSVGVIIAQCLAVVVQLEALADEGGWPVRQFLATTYFAASAVRVAAGAGLVVGCRMLGRGDRVWGAWFALGSSVLLAAGSAGMSHAVARVDHRPLLVALDALHQLAAAIWVGGLAHLTAAARGRGPSSWSSIILRRFSMLALGSVVALVLAGVGLSLAYLYGLPALLGTGYGAMVLTKVVVLAVLVGFGWANRRVIQGGEIRLAGPFVRVQRFVEAELGLGLVALLVAASLTSLPPAADVVAERATMAEVGARLAPQWPVLTSPKIGELPAPDRDTPSTAEDRAWSEYNHHMAGLFVLAMGLLAILQRLRWARWARHWPLVFLGLAAFLFLRNDPEAWPRGALGFLESLTDPVVFQHRVFVLLIVAFGVFEWLVRLGRLRAPGFGLVFPLLCAVSGALLLAHTHSADDLKQQLLIELSHIQLGLLATFVAWTRWLELRLPAPAGRLPGRLWPLGLTLVGVILLLYRES